MANNATNNREQLQNIFMCINYAKTLSSAYKVFLRNILSNMVNTDTNHIDLLEDQANDSSKCKHTHTYLIIIHLFI